MLKVSASDLPGNYQFNGIDVVKLICAYMVCIIHIKPFNIEAFGFEQLRYLNFGLQQCLCRIAVPFFFTASGFLLFRKMDSSNDNDNRFWGYCLRIIRLYGTWSILLCFGGKYQLWYLSALVVAVVIIQHLLKKGRSFRSVFLMSLVLFIIGLLGQPYYGLIEPIKQYHIPNFLLTGFEKVFPTTRNGIFFGMVFVMTGGLYARKRIVINSTIAVIGFVLSLILMIIEAFLLKMQYHMKGFDMLVSLLPAVFFLFYISTHIKLKDRHIFKSLRIIGVLVFFTHLFFDFVVIKAIQAVKMILGINLNMYRFILSVSLTTIAAIIIERLSRKERFNWLKYLYS